MRKVVDRNKDKSLDIVKVTKPDGEVVGYQLEAPAGSGNVLARSDYLSEIRQEMRNA